MIGERIMDLTVVVVLDQIGNRLSNCTEDRADALIEKGHAEAVSSSPPGGFADRLRPRRCLYCRLDCHGTRFSLFGRLATGD